MSAAKRKVHLFKESYFTLDGNLDWKVVLRKGLVFILLFIALFTILFMFLEPQTEAIAQYVSDHSGAPGLFLFAFLVDMLIVPLTVDMIFPFAVEYSPLVFLTLISAGSMLGGIGGYWIGRLLGHLKIVQQITGGFSEEGRQLISRYGEWGIVLAAFTPIPFSTVCWISGMVKVRFLYVVFATFARIPRMILYYFMLMAGFTLFR